MAKNKTNLYKLGQKKLEDILLTEKLVELDTLNQALQQGHTMGRMLEEILITNSTLNDISLAYILTSQYQVPYISLEHYEIPNDLVEQYKSLMVKYWFVPLARFDRLLTIAVATSFPPESIERLESDCDSDIFAYIGNFNHLKAAIDKYVPKEEQEIMHTEIIKETVQSPTCWESLFDFADESVRQELKEKSTSYLDGADEEYEEFLGIGLDQEESPPTVNFEENQEGAEDFSEQHAILEQLTEHLKDNPFDYDAVNQYVEVALSIGEMAIAVNQLLFFANGLDKAGDHEGAVNCYRYILELDPENQDAKKYLV